MSQNNDLMTILYLARMEETPDLMSIVSMIRDYGFYRQDKFGELVLIPPNTTDPDGLELREQLLDELAGGFKGGDYDPDYYYDDKRNHSLMAACGWTFGSLSEFHAAVNKLQGGTSDDSSEGKAPAPQSHFYTIFIKTLLTQAPKDVLNKIVSQGEKSDQTAILVKKLGLEELGITPKTFRSHLREAMGHYEARVAKLNKKHNQQDNGSKE